MIRRVLIASGVSAVLLATGVAAWAQPAYPPEPKEPEVMPVERELAVTGTDAWTLGLVGAGVLAAGGGALAVGRRRWRSSSQS